MITKDIHIGNFKNEVMNMAPMLVQTACKYNSSVTLKCDNRTINAKSIMGVMALILKPNSTVSLEVDGDDESEALESLAAFLIDSTK